MHKCIGEVCEGKVENVTPMDEFKSTGKAVALVIWEITPSQSSVSFLYLG